MGSYSWASTLQLIILNLQYRGDTENCRSSATLGEGITSFRRNEPFSKVLFSSQIPHRTIFFLPRSEVVVYLSLNIWVGKKHCFDSLPAAHQPGFGWKSKHDEYGTMQMLSWAIQTQQTLLCLNSWDTCHGFRWNNYSSPLENILYWKLFKYCCVTHQEQICACNVDYSCILSLVVWCIEKTCTCIKAAKSTSCKWASKGGVSPACLLAIKGKVLWKTLGTKNWRPCWRL